MYDNIGGKIKGLAKTIFIVEAIGAIISGIALFVTDDDFILAGLLTFFCGPIIAYVGSWILYAFGELVEKTCDNENNTRQILKKLNEKSTDDSIASTKNKECANKDVDITFAQNKEYANKTTNTPRAESAHKWCCGGCGKMRTQTPCEYCGKE